MRLSRRGKLGVAGLLTSVLIVFFASHYVQLSLMEHVSLKTFLVRMIASSQNLNTSSPMYGSFFNASWLTMEAVDILNILGALDCVDTDAVMQFLAGPGHAGPVDRPIQYGAKYSVDSAFLIAHTASVMERLGELPSTLIDKIRETVIANQNSTSRNNLFWRAHRTFLFETARLMNATEYVNSTLQKREILDDIVDRIWQEDVFHILHNLRALEELYRIETGHSNIALEYAMTDATRNMIEFYILSLWDDSRYGFYESVAESSRARAEGRLAATYQAIHSYMELSGLWVCPEKDALQMKVGSQFDRVLTFLSKCQNRYGIFFDKPSEASDKANSLEIWPTFNAIMLLDYIDRLDFLNQTVRWPPNPTLIESLTDQFINAMHL